MSSKPKSSSSRRERARAVEAQVIGAGIEVRVERAPDRAPARSSASRPWAGVLSSRRAARAQHAAHLREPAGGVGDVLDRLTRPHHIEARRRANGHGPSAGTTRRSSSGCAGARRGAAAPRRRRRRPPRARARPARPRTDLRRSRRPAPGRLPGRADAGRARAGSASRRSRSGGSSPSGSASRGSRGRRSRHVASRRLAAVAVSAQWWRK